MSQSQSLQITSRLSSHRLDAGLRRPGAALLVACALVSIAGTLRAEGLRLAVFSDSNRFPMRYTCISTAPAATWAPASTTMAHTPTSKAAMKPARVPPMLPLTS